MLEYKYDVIFLSYMKYLVRSLNWVYSSRITKEMENYTLCYLKSRKKNSDKQLRLSL